MNFTITEAILLDDALKKIGINRNIHIFHSDYLHFTLEQLSQIEELKIEGFESIDFLVYLPNLKRLQIKSEDYNQVIGDGTYQDNAYFNQIKDFNVINSLVNLETLSIENDICIQVLDVSCLQKLKNVSLINNPNLETIIGLDRQHHLENVLMYGNNIKEFSNINDYLYNTLDAKTNILDSSIFFLMISSIEEAKKLNDVDLKGMIELEFAEKNGLVNYTTITVAQMTELYIKFYRLFQKKHLFQATDIEKIEYVFKYATNYISFAEEELQKREQLYRQLKQEYQEIPVYYRKNFGSLHNSFNTYHFKSGNCEGFVNLMRIMLHILNIPTENVQCHDRRSQEMGLNHSILRAKCDNIWLYYDATYDRKHRKNFFGKTFQEMSEYLDLSVYEKMISEGKQYAIK